MVDIRTSVKLMTASTLNRRRCLIFRILIMTAAVPSENDEELSPSQSPSTSTLVLRVQIPVRLFHLNLFIILKGGSAAKTVP